MADGEGGGNPLQFDKADFGTAEPPSLGCTQCSQQIGSAYYEANGQVLCEKCRYGLEAYAQSRPGPAGFLKALAAGVGAGIVGWVIYYAVLALSGYEFGLIAILVGYMVGRAVRWGSGNRGGAAYQALAIALTYLTIVTTYVPVLVQSLKQQAAQEEKQASASGAARVQPAAPSAADAKPEPTKAAATDSAPPTAGQFVRALVVLGGIILALPFLQGFDNIVGLLIIGFGLFEAWKLNRRPRIVINGPFVVGGAPAVPAEAARP